MLWPKIQINEIQINETQTNKIRINKTWLKAAIRHNRVQPHIKDRPTMNKFSLPLMILGLSVSSLAFAQSTPLPETNTDSTPAETPLAPAPQVDFIFDEAPDDHVLGDISAPMTMITYASVTCSHCGNWFSNEWPAVKEALVDSGKMRFVLRELPTPPAILSMTGFLMAECAPKDAYFDVVQYQMENQQALFEAAKAGKGQEAYAKVGALANLNSDDEINACLSDNTNMDHMRLSGERANAAKVEGVPAFYINGELYKGRQDSETVITLIEGMIERGQSSLPEIEIPEPSMTTPSSHGSEGDHKGHNH